MKGEFLKIKRKIEEKQASGIIGFTSLDEGVSCDKLLEGLFPLMSDTFLIEFSKDGLDYKKIDQAGLERKLVLKYPDDFPSAGLENFIANLKKSASYILISEGQFQGDLAMELSKMEDGRVLMVKEDLTKKPDLRLAISDSKDLGLNILGVVYDK